MGDYKQRLRSNVPGKWFVDENCIDCDLCRETAPTVFRRDEESGNSFVFHQPETEEELRLAKEALEGCPVEAIGEDNPSPTEPTSPPAAEPAKPPVPAESENRVDD